jgi:hypothetical protein
MRLVAAIVVEAADDIPAIRTLRTPVRGTSVDEEAVVRVGGHLNGMGVPVRREFRTQTVRTARTLRTSRIASLPKRRPLR